MMGNRLTVDPRTLTPLVLVRIQVPQPANSRKSQIKVLSHPGRRLQNGRGVCSFVLGPFKGVQRKWTWIRCCIPCFRDRLPPQLDRNVGRHLALARGWYSTRSRSAMRGKRVPATCRSALPRTNSLVPWAVLRHGRSLSIFWTEWSSGPRSQARRVSAHSSAIHVGANSSIATSHQPSFSLDAPHVCIQRKTGNASRDEHAKVPLSGLIGFRESNCPGSAVSQATLATRVMHSYSIRRHAWRRLRTPDRWRLRRSTPSRAPRQRRQRRCLPPHVC